MFTGIVKGIGVVRYIEQKADTMRLCVEPTAKIESALGSSVAVNGCCLTVVDTHDNLICFEVIPKTVELTNLGLLKSGDYVNLEPSLKIGDELGGHIVMGHIDGTGKVVQIEDLGNSKQARVEVESSILKFVVPRGSVAVDGISLTVVEKNSKSFSVSLIPYTLENTIAKMYKKGTVVNIEVDVMSRYVMSFIAEHNREYIKSTLSIMGEE
jgi:riboflavin synthase